MNWSEHWKALSSKIIAVSEAAKQAQQALLINSSDDQRIIQTYVLSEILDLVKELKEFNTNHLPSLPNLAAECLSKFLNTIENKIDRNERHAHRILLLPVPFIIFKSQFDYLIHDTEIEGFTRTEAAFEHLRRSIAADEDTRNKWNAVFEKGEVECEKLGAVHLLHHRIWAFKIDGAKARTDLVYNEPLDESSVRRTATTLVLTEWKKVDDKNCDQKANEARNQTTEYSSGVLGDIELKRTRYIVLVSQHPLTKIPEDAIDEKGIKYRHINIAVNPGTPSKNSKK